jgi:hypothetical protein
MLIQVLIPWIEQYPREAPKLMIGDNLSTHVSPYVTDKCEEYNIRFDLQLHIILS